MPFSGKVKFKIPYRGQSQMTKFNTLSAYSFLLIMNVDNSIYGHYRIKDPLKQYDKIMDHSTCNRANLDL